MDTEADCIGFAPNVGRGLEVVALKEPKVVGAGEDPGPNEVEAGDKEKIDLTTGGLGCNAPEVPKEGGLPKTPTTGLDEVLVPIDDPEAPNRLEEDDWKGVIAGGAVLQLSLTCFGAPNKLELDT